MGLFHGLMHDQFIDNGLHFFGWAHSKKVRLIAGGCPVVTAVGVYFNFAGYKFIIRHGAVYGDVNRGFVPAHAAVHIIGRLGDGYAENVFYWVIVYLIV